MELINYNGSNIAGNAKEEVVDVAEHGKILKKSKDEDSVRKTEGVREGESMEE